MTELENWYNDQQSIHRVFGSPLLLGNQSLIESTNENPSSIIPILTYIQNNMHKHPDIVQFALKSFKITIDNCYTQLQEENKQTIKTYLLSKLTSNQIHQSLRFTIASCVTSIATQILLHSSNDWPELLCLLNSSNNNNNTSNSVNSINIKEVCYVIWRNLVTCCGDTLKSDTDLFNNILSMLHNELKLPLQATNGNTNNNIQMECINCIDKFIYLLSIENMQDEYYVTQLQQYIIPLIIDRLHHFVNIGHRAYAIKTISILKVFIESEFPLFSKVTYFKVISLTIKLTSDINTPWPVRYECTKYMTSLCECKPKIVLSFNLIPVIISMCVKLLTEYFRLELSYKNDTVKFLGEQNDIYCKSLPNGEAAEILDALCLHVATDAVFYHIIQALDELFKTNNVIDNASGFVIIALMAEGCSDFMLKGNNIKLLLRQCVVALSFKTHDKSQLFIEYRVYKQSLSALQQLCLHLENKVCKFHKNILPVMFNLFNDHKTFQNVQQQNDIKQAALDTLESFISNIKTNALSKYIQDIMNIVVQCLESGNHSIKKSAIDMLGSTASKLQQRTLIPYMPKLLQILEPLLQVDDTIANRLQSISIGCLGSIFKNVQYAAFKSVLNKYHGYVMKLFLQFDTDDILESCYWYFASLTESMGNKVIQLDSFDDMIGTVLLELENEDGLNVELPEDGFGAYNTRMAQIKCVQLRVNKGYVDKKVSAMYALSVFMKYGKISFIDRYYESYWDCLCYLLELPNESILRGVSNCLEQHFKQIVMADIKNKQYCSKYALDSVEVDNNDIYKYPYSFTENIEYSSRVQRFITDIFPKCISGIKENEFEDVLCTYLDDFQLFLRVLGPLSLEQSNFRESLILAINSYFTEQCRCQKNADIYNDETIDIQTKYIKVTKSLCFLIVALAEIYSNEFPEKVFNLVIDNMLKFVKPTRNTDDQNDILYCIGNICERLNTVYKKCTVMSQYVDIINPFLFKMINENNNNQHISLYAIGEFVTGCNDSVNSKYLDQILNIILKFIKYPRDGTKYEQLCRDNSISALAKVLRTEVTILLDENNKYKKMKLLQLFIDSMPLTVDDDECKNVFNTIMYLIDTNVSDFGTIYLHKAILLLSKLDGYNDRLYDKVPWKVKEKAREIVKSFKDKNNKTRVILPLSVCHLLSDRY